MPNNTELRINNKRDAARITIDRTPNGGLLIQVGTARVVRDASFVPGPRSSDNNNFEWNSIRLGPAATLRLRRLLSAAT